MPFKYVDEGTATDIPAWIIFEQSITDPSFIHSRLKSIKRSKSDSIILYRKGSSNRYVASLQLPFDELKKLPEYLKFIFKRGGPFLFAIPFSLPTRLDVAKVVEENSDEVDLSITYIGEQVFLDTILKKCQEDALFSMFLGMPTGDLTTLRNQGIKQKELTWKTSSLLHYTQAARNSAMTKAWGIGLHEYAEIIEPISKKLEEEVKDGSTIYPPLQLVYESIKRVSPKKCKVLILGQDPYHTSGAANGLAFSITTGRNLQPSLKNIYKEVINCGFTIQSPNDGDLSKWVDQGVILLNTALTVIEGQPASHADLWKEFTAMILTHLSNNTDGMVAMLWGKHACDYRKYLKSDKIKVLTTSHPSPYSASYGFLGSKIFVNANDLLKKIKKEPIDWSL